MMGLLARRDTFFISSRLDVFAGAAMIVVGALGTSFLDLAVEMVEERGADAFVFDAPFEGDELAGSTC